ncbi:MAG: hypothetical protein GX345_03170 [Clostridiales bacterium]|nr:hypothetical protein [Clostridiales bacterium]
MIDIHSHILYGMDDGPRDIETSFALCRMAVENGIDQVFATSHLTQLHDIASYVQARDDRIKNLQELVDQRGLGLKIYPGAEVYASDDLFFTDSLESVTMNKSRYLLVEFPMRGISFSTVLRYVEHIFEKGLTPIIAHPERYSFIQKQYDRANFLLDMGALLQVNAASLAGMDGREEFELAYEMVLKNAANFIATDAHSLRNRPNNLLRMIRYFPPNISRRGLDRMLNISPQAVVNNEPVPRSLDTGLLRRRR